MKIWNWFLLNQERTEKIRGDSSEKRAWVGCTSFYGVVVKEGVSLVWSFSTKNKILRVLVSRVFDWFSQRHLLDLFWGVYRSRRLYSVNFFAKWKYHSVHSLRNRVLRNHRLVLYANEDAKGCSSCCRSVRMKLWMLSFVWKPTPQLTTMQPCFPMETVSQHCKVRCWNLVWRPNKERATLISVSQDVTREVTKEGKGERSYQIREKWK